MIYVKIVILMTFIQYSSNFQLENENLKEKYPGFLLSVPKLLLSAKNETICISLHNAAIPAKVIVDLKAKDQHFITKRHLDSENSCFDLHVPLLILKEPQLVSIHVQVQLNGSIYSSHNYDPILLYPNKKLTFIETDRTIYEARSRVKIRILILNQELLPMQNHIIPVVKIKNPYDITVVVWENITTDLGLIQLEHHLGQGSLEGKWKIEVEEEIHYFEVNKYVSPRFKVDVFYPKTIFYETPSVAIKVCATYTYGRPVKGTAFIRLTDSHSNMNPQQELQQVDSNGCTNFTFTKQQLNFHNIKEKFSLYNVKMYMYLAATVTEFGTDRIEIMNAKSFILMKAYNMKFDQSLSTFQSGLPYKGRLLLSNVTLDLQGEVIEICYNIAVKKSWNYINSEYCSNFTVSNSIVVGFHVPPLKHNIIHIHLHARSLNYTNVGDSFLVIRSYSPSNSYIKLEKTPSEKSLCPAPQQFWIQFTTEHFVENENLTFYYMIKTPNSIFKMRKVVHRVQKLNNSDYEYSDSLGSKNKFVRHSTPTDKFQLQFKINPQPTFSYQLIVYYVTNKSEIVADVKDVELPLCLQNNVSANWTKKKAYPGSAVVLNLKTSSDSLCSISAIDKSATFLSRNHNFILNSNTFTNYVQKERDLPESGRKACIPPTKRHKQASPLISDFELRKKRYVFSYSEDYDAYDIFKNFGTVVITNLKIITKSCYTGPAVFRTNNPIQLITNQYDIQNEEKRAPIRSYFPETWLWELIPVRGGQPEPVKVERELPHTITNWMTNVMCVSATESVGFSSTLEISAFQPFFVEVLTPHYIKNNEVLYLHVISLNYLNYSLPIRVTLRESQGLKFLAPLFKRSVSFCIAPLNSVTRIFEIQATMVGQVNVTIFAEVDPGYPGVCGPDTVVNRRDVVFKQLVVEPEGFLVEKPHSALLCGDESFNNITWTTAFSQETVSGTASLKMILNGDLMGSTIENLEDLITMPMGCGEQIMSSFAPNLYILRYLNAIDKLTSSIRQRAIRNLKMGYQRILNYVHKDGSFSAFGHHDPFGSMFLTAFVVRSLQAAKFYIFVDQGVIDKAISWIFEHQLENGCFNTMLHVFQDMGETATENSTAGLTAYVMISLLEAGIDVPESIKTNAKYCIRSHYHLDKYTLAISSYALFKIGWYSEANRMLNKLMQIVNQRNNMLWWSNKDGSVATDIEMTSYVLLSLVHYRTYENLAFAHAVVRWLSSQKGANGGFKSTQDTTIALDALEKYCRFIKMKTMNLIIDVNARNQQQKITMKNEDVLKAKRITLLEVDNEITVTVSGQGCVLVQLVESYNRKKISANDAFKLNVEVSPVSTIDECSIATLSPCLAFIGSSQQPNMAVLEINLPSGYDTDRESLYNLLRSKPSSKVKMFEEIENRLVLYFTKLDTTQICVNFKINKNSIVHSRTESTVKLYDYYKPEFEVMQFYQMNENCKLSNYTMPQVCNITEDGTKRLKRNSKQNPDFVIRNIDLEESKCEELQFQQYIKPNTSAILGRNFSTLVEIIENE